MRWQRQRRRRRWELRMMVAVVVMPVICLRGNAFLNNSWFVLVEGDEILLHGNIVPGTVCARAIKSRHIRIK